MIIWGVQYAPFRGDYMRIIGIDASTNMTGIAVFEDGKYVTHTLIDLHRIKESDKRIPMMMVAICDYLDKCNADKIIMEKSMFTNNIATVQMLSQLAGAVLLYATKNGVDIEFAMPSAWRKTVGLSQSSKIKREVLKQEAIAAVKQEYGLDITDDESEAVLISRSGFDLPKIVLTQQNE